MATQAQKKIDAERAEVFVKNNFSKNATAEELGLSLRALYNTAARVGDAWPKKDKRAIDEKMAEVYKKKGSSRAAGRAFGVDNKTILAAVKRVGLKADKKEPKTFFKATAGDIQSNDRGNDIPERSWPASAKRFVITSAVNATPIHKEFFGALAGYCERNSAELIVVPLRYHNPTSLWSQAQDDSDWWSAELAPFIIASRQKINKNLELLADVKTQPTAVDPLSGMHALTGTASAIIAHPQIAYTTIPTPQSKLAKILATTGAVTIANYSKSKAGARGEFHHAIGALVVEIDDDDESKFHLRHIIADEVSGAFHDLEREYFADGSSVGNGGVAAVVLGDAHIDFIDEDVVRATFRGTSSIMSALRPALVVWHDVLDSYSVSHHHAHDPLIKYAKHHAGRGDISAEIDRCFAFIDANTPPTARPVIVGSNHNDHLGRWVRETDPRRDPTNALVWAELYAAMLRETKMGPSGSETIDPFRHLAAERLKSYSRSIWPSRGESFSVHGVELGMHGDKGPNGSRGSRRALDKIGTKSVIGHSHSPGITGGCYQVGTSSKLDLEYTSGSPSSWLHTHCVIYKNGKRALVTCVGGKWRRAIR